MSTPRFSPSRRGIDSFCKILQNSSFYKKRIIRPPAFLLGVFFMLLSPLTSLIDIATATSKPQTPQAVTKLNHNNSSHQKNTQNIHSKIIKKTTEHALSHTDKQALTTQNSSFHPSRTYHQLSLNERLALIEDKIQHATSQHETSALWERAENLRFHSLNAASRLLIDEADTQMQSQHISQAIDAINSAIALQPTNNLLHRKRAAIRIIGNDPIGAIDDLAFTLNSDPCDPTAWLLLTRAENIIHNNHIALSTFQKALNCAPHMPQKEEMLKELQKKAYGQED